jgi:hypothetical protein
MGLDMPTFAGHVSLNLIRRRHMRRGAVYKEFDQLAQRSLPPVRLSAKCSNLIQAEGDRGMFEVAHNAVK